MYASLPDDAKYFYIQGEKSAALFRFVARAANCFISFFRFDERGAFFAGRLFNGQKGFNGMLELRYAERLSEEIPCSGPERLQHHALRARAGDEDVRDSRAGHFVIFEHLKPLVDIFAAIEQNEIDTAVFDGIAGLFERAHFDCFICEGKAAEQFFFSVVGDEEDFAAGIFSHGMPLDIAGFQGILSSAAKFPRAPVDHAGRAFRHPF